MVDNKKRIIKEKAKELKEKRNFRETNIDKILWKTPNIDKLKFNSFATPIKESVEKNELPIELRKIKQTLFSESSYTEKELNSKSERKLTPSSENSMAKRSKSVINTSDLKCSEALTPK